jgi:hypothetical protein
VLQVGELDHLLHLAAEFQLGAAHRAGEQQVLHPAGMPVAVGPTSGFCNTVACSKSSMFWKVRAMPWRATTCGGMREITSPSKRTSPGRAVERGNQG